LKIKFRYDLLTIDLLLGILLLLVFFLPSNILRIVLGLPFVLFFPGYIVMAALYPRQGSISGIERVALSFGLSLAVIPLIGLALNYSPWGITLNSILFTETAFILVLSGVTWFRRRALTETERFSIDFTIDIASIWGPGAINKVLTIALVIAILGTIGTLVYVIAKPKTGEKFTEFYILGTEGKAENYPRELTPGEEAKVLIGIVNHEHQVTTYHVDIKIGDVVVSQTDSITLAHDEKWEGEVGFSTGSTGTQKVEFFLYKNGETVPYLDPLRLWIEVKELP
jgi:uncharacterized membrane protein